MESRLAFILANAQLSIGTARSEGDEADTDLALGLRLTLADRGDPLRSGEFRRALADALLDCAPAQPDPTPSDACVSRETEAAWEAWTADHWNAARLAVAAAWGSGSRNPSSTSVNMRAGAVGRSARSRSVAEAS